MYRKISLNWIFTQQIVCSQAVAVHQCWIPYHQRCYLNSNSNFNFMKDKNDNDHLYKDPEVKKWLKQIKGDFDAKNSVELKHNCDDTHCEEIVESVKYEADNHYEKVGDKLLPEAYQKLCLNLVLDPAVELSQNGLEEHQDIASFDEAKLINDLENDVNNISSSNYNNIQQNINETFSYEPQKFVSKYSKFGANSQIIYDFDEEIYRKEQGLMNQDEIVEKEEILFERGVCGVFDVAELVELLKEENAKNIVAIKIPMELKYASHMVLASSKTLRHINALSELIRIVYKKKKNVEDRFIKIEGKESDWVAIDLGNIILHIMKPEVREAYDLETLWTVGSNFDDMSQEAEDFVQNEFSLANSLPQDSSSYYKGNNYPQLNL